MRTSLSLKMLLLTLGSFVILIFGIIVSLYIYFDRFYEPQKIDHMINAINEFTSDFEEDQWTDEQLYTEVSKFMKSQNATMSIQSQTTNYFAVATQATPVNPKASPDFFILSNRLAINKLMNPLYSRNIIGASVANPLVAIMGQTLTMSSDSLTAPAPRSFGTATNINGSLVLYPVATLEVATEDNIEVYNKNGIDYIISSLPYTNYRQVNFNKLSTLKSGEKKITNVNLSLQSVQEVTDFLIRFFPFLIGAAILLSFIMVAVYSKTISKPIVSITNTANRMANMELGITSNINRKDELGALSTSLNTLSTNLKTALDDLSFANKQLKADYESELLQEKVRKEFVANVSHELKTPLGIIKSYSEGIRDGVKAEKKDYYVEVILEEITRMDQMIIEMLEISKFDAGVVLYTKKNNDFILLIDRVIRNFRNKAKEKEVTFDIFGEFGSVLMDEEKIERVFNNLIDNAVKYCNPHSIIRIQGERTNSLLTVQVKNDCLLLSDDALSKIWDRFYKADTSHNRDMEGTGLGLAITKSILDGHGCSYGVNNTDQGICFYVSLDVNL